MQKFRIWDGKTMHYPEGDPDVYLSMTGKVYILGLVTLYDHEASIDPSCDTAFIEIQNAIVMPCVGLKDCNDKEIYEGDLISLETADDNFIGVIKFGDYNNGDLTFHLGYYVDFVKTLASRCFRRDLGFWSKETKVIGNIHENPELLKGA